MSSNQSQFEEPVIETSFYHDSHDITVSIWQDSERLVMFSDDGEKMDLEKEFDVTLPKDVDEVQSVGFEIEYIAKVETRSKTFREIVRYNSDSGDGFEAFVDNLKSNIQLELGDLSYSELVKEYKDGNNRGAILSMTFHEKSVFGKKMMEPYISDDLKEYILESEIVEYGGNEFVIDTPDGEVEKEQLGGHSIADLLGRDFVYEDSVECPVDGCDVSVSEDGVYEHCIERHGWWDESLRSE